MNRFIRLKIKLILYRLVNDMDSYQRYYWVNNLDIGKIDNLLKLKIKHKMLKNMKWLITDLDLLECDNYVERINFLSKINPTFYDILYLIRDSGYLKSPYLIEDLKIIKNNPLIDFLDLLKEPIFLNSKYHLEDLKLIVNEYKKSKDISYLIKLAINNESIESKYHLDDMRELAENNSEYAYKLAINPVSLKDEYHLENMKLLRNSYASKYLYLLMTNEKVIDNKFYRKCVEYLADAKSENNASFAYSYIIEQIINNTKSNQEIEFNELTVFEKLSNVIGDEEAKNKSLH